MKKILLPVVLVAVALCGCKTTEANYRAAYDKAVAGRDSAMAFEQTIYGLNRRNIGTRTAVSTTGDSAEVRTMHVARAKGYEDAPLKPYNVVVGEFKQLFNANSMCTRLRQGGYPGAFVVNNGEPYHYIVLSSFERPSEAIKALKAIKKLPVTIKPPCPYILYSPGAK